MCVSLEIVYEYVRNCIGKPVNCPVSSKLLWQWHVLPNDRFIEVKCGFLP